MKFNNMKSLIPVAAFTLMIGFSSCVGDLDVKPINPQQTMTLDQNAPVSYTHLRAHET